MLVAPMVERLHAHTELEAALNAAVSDAVALQGGEFGDIQFRMENGDLVLVAGKNLPNWFVAAFSHLAPQDGTSCAKAAKERRTILIKDVETDADFKPYVEKARELHFRSVISCPLIASDRACLGVISVHFATSHVPSAIEIESLQRYCKQAADYFQARIGPGKLRESAERLQAHFLRGFKTQGSAPAVS